MTQPTMGLGSTKPWPAAASSRARRMCQRSSSWGSMAWRWLLARGPDFAAAAGLRAVGGPQLAGFGRGRAFGRRQGLLRQRGAGRACRRAAGRRPRRAVASRPRPRPAPRMCCCWMCWNSRTASSALAVAEAERQFQQVPGGAGLAGRQRRLPPLLDVGQGLGEILGGLGQGDIGVKPFGIVRPCCRVGSISWAKFRSASRAANNRARRNHAAPGPCRKASRPPPGPAAPAAGWPTDVSDASIGSSGGRPSPRRRSLKSNFTDDVLLPRLQEQDGGQELDLLRRIGGRLAGRLAAEAAQRPRRPLLQQETADAAG